MTLALDRMRELWEFSPMTARQIGARLRTTKNTVIGHADRGGWASRKEYRKKPSTVFTRLAALDRSMERVLAETRPFVEDRPKVMVTPA